MNIVRENILFSIIKLITYVAASVELLSGSGEGNTTVYIVLLSVLITNSYFRQLYMYERFGFNLYEELSMIGDVLLIAVIGALDGIWGATVYFFLVCISESAIVYKVRFSLFITTLVTFITFFFMMSGRVSYNIMDLLKEFFSTIQVGYIFTFVMSYSVRRQLLEREKTNRINKELENAYKRLMESSSKAQQLSIEQERTRMAREIHDTLAHTLTAAIVQMEACKKILDVDANRAKKEIEKAQVITREGLNDVKHTIKALRPQVLENGSFFDALLILIDDVRKNTKVDICFKRDIPDDFKLPAEMEVALFRVLQESITNAIRHGSCSNIIITIKLIDNNLNININDDGEGCSHIVKGYGLQGITERIESLKGAVSFLSTEGNGFNTNIVIPFKGDVGNVH